MSGIVLGRERTQDNSRKKEHVRLFPVTKLRKNGVPGRQLLRKVRLRMEGDNITMMGFIHPEKPQKSFELPISSLIEVFPQPKEKRFRLDFKGHTEAIRLAFNTDSDFEEFFKCLESSQISCIVSNPLKRNITSDDLPKIDTTVC